MKSFLLLISALLISATSLSQTYEVGDKPEVLSDGAWYLSTILKIEDGKYFIKYDDWDESYNVWKTKEQLRKKGTFSIGDRLEGLETDGLWYAATILEVGEDKYKIHWEGFIAEYDRWIEASNLRIAQNKPVENTGGSTWGINEFQLFTLKIKLDKI